MPRVAPAVSLNQTTKAALDQLVRSPSTPQGLVQRGRIVLAAAAGKSNQQIAAALAIPEVTVGKCERHDRSDGPDGGTAGAQLRQRIWRANTPTHASWKSAVMTAAGLPDGAFLKVMMPVVWSSS